jgi:hypothetical protein
LRTLLAPAGSVANSLANIGIGAAQLPSGIVTNAQLATVNGAQSLIAGAYGTLPSQMFADAPGVVAAANSSAGQWGIFAAGTTNIVLTPDSFKSLNYKQGWRIANYPMEQGAFQSYNKVQTPFEVKVAFTKGGGDSERTNFLSTLATLANSFDLYDVVTPEITYSNVSIESYDYVRTAINGAKLLTVDISLLQIRLAAAANFTNTATPSGSGTVNGGIVQPIPVTTGPNLAPDGNPTSAAQSASGEVAPPTSVAPPEAVPPAAAAAVTSSQTPAVSATPPAFDDKLRDANGNIVTPTAVNPLTGRTQTANGYFQVNPNTGHLMQYDKDGSVVKIASPADDAIQ